jgi:hypothetical protein
MMNPITACVIIFAIFGIGMVFEDASDVGKARAKAQEGCYKAAQVNPNIKCDGASK